MYEEQQPIRKFLKHIGTSGDVEKLKKFQEEHPHPHWHILQHEKSHDTILHIACRLGHIEIVKFIADNYKPMLPDYRNKLFKNPLHDAAQFGYPEIAEILLNNGASVNALKCADWTPLMLACTKIGEQNYVNNKTPENTYRMIKLLCDRGALVNFRNKDGWSALHLIAREGTVRILDLLVQYDLNINDITKNNRTALHIAALHGHKDFVEKLLRYGLEVNKRDSCGNIPLHESVLGDHFEIFILLIENRSDILCRNNAGFNVLNLAACKGNMLFIKYMIEVLKFDVNIKNSDCVTPLHCAARHNQKEVYDYLVKMGGDLYIKDCHGRTAGDYLNICSK